MGLYIKTNDVTGAAIDIKTQGDTSEANLVPGDDRSRLANKIKVESKYQGKTLTVPFMYIRSTELGPWGRPVTLENMEKVHDSVFQKDVSGKVRGYRGITSGSALHVDDGSTITSYKKSSLDKYYSSIDKINEWQIRWEDLYDVNTARYTRKDAYLTLQLFIDEEPAKYYLDTNGLPCKSNDNIKSSENVPDGNKKPWTSYEGCYNNGTVVEKRITISDAPEQPANIKFTETTITWNPSNTAIENDIIINGPVDRPWEKKVRVYDQYGQENDGGRKVLYTVSDYTENPDGRLEKNYTIDKNGSNSSVVKGVERGDSYTLTANLENSGLTAKATIKAGGDDAAVIESSKVMSQSSEYTLRNKYLGYNR